MGTMNTGTFRPLQATLDLDTPPYDGFTGMATIQKVEQYAGSAMGVAVVNYASSRVADATRVIGSKAIIKVGSTIIFRGNVAHSPFQVDDSTDEVQLVLVDDKWLMAANRIGQYKIGNEGTPAGVEGFSEVGFEVIFNKDGMPNKDPDPDKLMFNCGPDAIFWTLGDVMLFIFSYYIDTTVARIAYDDVDTDAYKRQPSNLNLIGQTALQAVDAVAQLAGESWGLIPTSEYSRFRTIRAGSGTVRTAPLFRPMAKAQVTAAGENYPSDVHVALTVENSRDMYQVFSANVVKETVYTSVGDNALLHLNSSFLDKEYAARFEVDVTQYAANHLGRNLKESAPLPKPWLSELLTRLNEAGTDYISAGDIVSDPGLLKNKRVKIPIWIATDGTAAHAKLCVGKYRIDVKHGYIDFEAAPEIMADQGTNRQPLQVTDWTAVGIWMTVATVLEMPEIKESTGTGYLPCKMYDMIVRPDLVPERRQKSWLPDLTDSSAHKIVEKAASAEEKYVDVGSIMTEIAASALAQTPSLETPIDLTLPFFPIWQVGDRIQITGRSTGASGNEVIIGITYSVHENFQTKVQASNVMKAVDPEKFVRKR